MEHRFHELVHLLGQLLQHRKGVRAITRERGRRVLLHRAALPILRSLTVRALAPLQPFGL